MSLEDHILETFHNDQTSFACMGIKTKALLIQSQVMSQSYFEQNDSKKKII